MFSRTPTAAADDMSMTTAVTLRRTECITFPRSGHHLLVRLLERYFGEALAYCEMYEQPERLMEVDPATNFQKNHDLELDTPIHAEWRYLVQIRYPLDSIVSWFQQACETGQAVDQPGAWTNFAIQKTAFWMRFYRRWVLAPLPRRLVINYAELVSEPSRALRQVIEFMMEEPPDDERIREICRSETIRRRSTLRSFRYYGPEFFDLLRGLFAAVPGVDVSGDRLVVAQSKGSGGGDDGLAGAIEELRQTGRRLEAIARQLSAAASG